MLRGIMRNPLRIFSYLYGWLLARGITSNKTFPVVLNSPGLGVTLKKHRTARIIINGRLVIDKRDAPGALKGPLIEVQENAVLIINNTVLLGPNTHILVGKNAELIIGNPDDTKTSLSYGCKIVANLSVKIGSACALAWDTLVMDTSTHKVNGQVNLRPVNISDHVWLAARAVVLKGVDIGYGAIVATGSVVTKSVPARSLAAGNPAKILKENVRWDS